MAVPEFDEMQHNKNVTKNQNIDFGYLCGLQFMSQLFNFIDCGPMVAQNNVSKPWENSAKMIEQQFK